MGLIKLHKDNGVMFSLISEQARQISTLSFLIFSSVSNVYSYLPLCSFQARFFSPSGDTLPLSLTTLAVGSQRPALRGAPHGARDPDPVRISVDHIAHGQAGALIPTDMT